MTTTMLHKSSVLAALFCGGLALAGAGYLPGKSRMPALSSRKQKRGSQTRTPRGKSR